jgi:hypothetical protein
MPRDYRGLAGVYPRDRRLGANAVAETEVSLPSRRPDHLGPVALVPSAASHGLMAAHRSTMDGSMERGYFRSRAQTAAACTLLRRASSAPSGAGMLSVVVTERRPSAVAAAHCTYPGKLPVWP